MLIVGLSQLPHRMLFNICVYLSDCYDINIVSPDDGMERKTSNLFKVMYIRAENQSSAVKAIKKVKTFLRILRILIQTRRMMSFLENKSENNIDIVYIWDQTWAIAYKLILGNRHKYVMQLFAPGVTSSKIKNAIHDLQVKINVRFFDHVFMGSQRAKKVFKVPEHKAHIIGVGVEAPDFRIRNFDEINLVYLGVLSNRFIHESVKGFAEFYRENRDKISMKYMIIGGGYEDAVRELKASIDAAGDDVPIEYLGRLDDDEVDKVFIKSNIGVVYHRITPYYTNNISTKLYEYLLSGMPVIAVKSNSLLSAINSENGVLIKDNPNSFKEGLRIIMANLNNYNSSVIAKSGDAYSVRRVVHERMIPNFNRIVGE